MTALIPCPYLLSVSAPSKIDGSGRRWCDPLWAKDLALHLSYIDELILVAPRIYAEASQFDVSLDTDEFAHVHFVDLNQHASLLGSIKDLPFAIKSFWDACRKAAIVHTGFGSWPIAEGWIAAPIAKIQGKFLITLVESSFWRSQPGARLKHRLRSVIGESINRFLVTRSDLPLFTSLEYRNQFLGPRANRGHVIAPVWIDEISILSDQQAGEAWGRKTGPIRILFAGRLIPEKGLGVLLQAMEIFSPRLEISLSIIGDGPLKDQCLSLCERNRSVHVLEPVNYGPPFFDLVSQYDAIVIPSLSDEQPRVIFDAASQAVPTLGSDTGGIREVVGHGVGGMLFPRNNPAALARTLEWASTNRPQLMAFGTHALNRARHRTHRIVHQERRKIIEDAVRLYLSKR